MKDLTMALTEYEIRYGLLQEIEERGPIGWYQLANRPRIPPESFPRGMRMSYFLQIMLEEGLLKGSEDTQYEITDLGRDFLRRGTEEAEA